MATQTSEERGNPNHAEPTADIEAAPIRTESASSKPRGAPDMSENGVDELRYKQLVRAAIRGDWDCAKIFFDQDPSLRRAKITNGSETVLHIAALSAQDQFVEKLVGLLPPDPEALAMTDCNGQTALHIAVQCGSIRMVKALVRLNPMLTQLQDDEGCVPLEVSAWEAPTHTDVVRFLAEKTTDAGPSHPFSNPSAFLLIVALTVAGHHDITLDLVERYPDLINFKGLYILDALAKVKSHFYSGTRLGVLENLIYKCRIPVDLNSKLTDENSDPACKSLTRLFWNAAKTIVPTIKRIHKVKLTHALSIELAKRVCTALSLLTTDQITECFKDEDLLSRTVSWGIPELMEILIEVLPEFIWLTPYGRKLRTTAVKYCQESILRLFLKGSSTNKLPFVPAPTWDESKRMMMAAAKYETNLEDVTRVSGAVFELQRELQWFKAMEMSVMPDVRTAKHKGKTYWQIFVKEHKELRQNGEKWVKDTAKSCMLVSTLIATVLFAAAFTVPGGNDQTKGVPLLVRNGSLLVFAISDALGLFSSVMAIMLFLAILTSRSEWEDFIFSLPKKIIMGLSLLSLSLVFMLVAFAAALTIVLDKRLDWVFIPITVLASATVLFFLRLHLPLLFQMVKSTYGHGIFRLMGIRKRHIIIGRYRMIDELDLRV